MSRIAVLIVAAGKGERAGTGLPKQYERLAGKPMLRRTVEAFRGSPRTSGDRRRPGGTGGRAPWKVLPCPPPVTGGATRQESVRLGLEALAKDAPDFVLIHDAARPLISRKVIGDCGRGAGSRRRWRSAHGGGQRHLAPARCEWPLDLGAAGKSLPRPDAAGLCLCQDPDGAPRPCGRRRRPTMWPWRELAGLKVEMVEGEEKNIKVTRKEDFALAESLLAFGRCAHAPPAMTCTNSRDGDHIWLCGLKIAAQPWRWKAIPTPMSACTPSPTRCWAASAKAISASISRPRTNAGEARRRGNSWIMPPRLVAAKGGVINHVDVTIICERPKVGPHREAMKAQDRGDSEDRTVPGQREGHHHRRPGLYRPPRRHRRPGHRHRETVADMKLPAPPPSSPRCSASAISMSRPAPS